MTTRERVEAAVLDAIDEINAQQPAGKVVKKSLDAVLYGAGGGFDSLGLVNVVVAVEERVEAFAGPVTIADDRAMSREHSPFATPGALIDYVTALVEGAPSE